MPRTPLTRGPAITVVTAMAAAVVLCPSPQARADDEHALNGKFIVASDGRWATVRERYSDVPSVRAVWTITTTCTAPDNCDGTMSSDQGWSAPIRRHNEAWTVEHVIPDWQKCPDGTTSPGRQLFRFWRVLESGGVDITNTSPYLFGEDKTLGESGACGVNKWLTINMPFIMRRAD